MAQLVKNPPANAGDTRRPRFNPWVGKIPWRREPTPVFWPGEFHGLVHGVTKSRTWLSDFHFTIHSAQQLWNYVAIGEFCSLQVEGGDILTWEHINMIQWFPPLGANRNCINISTEVFKFCLMQMSWKRPWCWERLKGTTEDEMFGWHHWLDRHEFE